MALKFADGFDHYVIGDILKKWTGYVAGTAMTTNDISPRYARPPGGMGLKFNDTNANRGYYKALDATHASFVCGFWIKFATTPTTSPFWGVYDTSSGTPGTTYQLALRGDGAGHLQVTRGASGANTVNATSTNVMAVDTWYHVEIKATINNTTGAYEVKVNGSSTGWIPAATGQNTRGQSANNFIDAVAILNNGAGLATFDDFYFLSSTSPNNDFLGPQKIMTGFPAAAGNYSQWTGNYATNFANVNELGGDLDETFNQSSTANQIDSYVFDDVPAGTIAAIQHTILARQDAGAARTIAPIQRSGGTDYVGTSIPVPAGYQFLTDPKDVDPATTAAYTVANFNAAEFGVKLIS